MACRCERVSFFRLWLVYGQAGKESLVEVKPIYNPLEARQSGVLPFLRVKQLGVGWIVFREVDSHSQESQTVLGCLRSEFPDLFEKTFCRAPLQFIRFLDPDIDQVTGYADVHPWYSHQSRREGLTVDFFLFSAFVGGALKKCVNGNYVI